MSRLDPQWFTLGKSYQDLFDKCKVYIIGAGGTSIPTIIYLISSGIYNITVIDGDKIEYSNLARQFLYSIEDIGSLKVNILKTKIKYLFNLELNIISEYITIDNIDKYISSNYVDHTYIIDCTDNLSIKYLLDDFSYQYHIKWISISAIEDRASLIGMNHQYSYKDIFGKYLYNKSDTCNTVGIIASICGIIASFSVRYLIDLLVDKRKPGVLFTYSNYLFNKYYLPIRDNTLHKDLNSNSMEELNNKDNLDSKIISYNQALDIISNNKGILIDVRTDEEYNNFHLDNSISIPLSTINFDNLKDTYKDKDIIFYCRHGKRSHIALVRSISNHMNNTYSIRDGIDNLIS